MFRVRDTPPQDLFPARFSPLRALPYDSHQTARQVHVPVAIGPPVLKLPCGWIPRPAGRSAHKGEKSERSYTSAPPRPHRVHRRIDLGAKEGDTQAVDAADRDMVELSDHITTLHHPLQVFLIPILPRLSSYS